MPSPLDDDALDVVVDQTALIDEKLSAGLLARQHEHRHRQLGHGEGGEVFGVLLEGAERLEPRPHAAGLGIGGRVEPAIRLGDGMGRIGREVVPEMLEIDALAALDQREGCLSVEVEMPKVPEEPDALPIAHAGQKRVHQGNPVDIGRMLGGVGIGDHQPDVMTHDRDAPVPERCGEGVDVLRHRLLVVTRVRLGRFPEASQVGSDDRMGLSEFGDKRPPHMAGLRVTMQEKHRIAFAGDQIVKLGSVDLGKAALDRDRRLRWCRCGDRSRDTRRC
jgi:hypothetical protein